jgi:hypothetical protein
MIKFSVLVLLPFVSIAVFAQAPNVSSPIVLSFSEYHAAAILLHQTFAGAPEAKPGYFGFQQLTTRDRNNNSIYGSAGRHGGWLCRDECWKQYDCIFCKCFRKIGLDWVTIPASGPTGQAR